MSLNCVFYHSFFTVHEFYLKKNLPRLKQVTFTERVQGRPWLPHCDKQTNQNVMFIPGNVLISKRRRGRREEERKWRKRARQRWTCKALTFQNEGEAKKHVVPVIHLIKTSVSEKLTSLLSQGGLYKKLLCWALTNVTWDAIERKARWSCAKLGLHCPQKLLTPSHHYFIATWVPFPAGSPLCLPAHAWIPVWLCSLPCTVILTNTWRDGQWFQLQCKMPCIFSDYWSNNCLL